MDEQRLAQIEGWLGTAEAGPWADTVNFQHAAEFYEAVPELIAALRAARAEIARLEERIADMEESR